MDAEDVGAFYEGPNGSVWRLIAYAAQPTATLERVYPNEGPSRRDGVVGSQVFAGYRKLVPEEPT